MGIRRKTDELKEEFAEENLIEENESIRMKEVHGWDEEYAELAPNLVKPEDITCSNVFEAQDLYEKAWMEEDKLEKED